MQANPDSRPVLSLLGWCYYHTMDFNSAASACHPPLASTLASPWGVGRDALPLSDEPPHLRRHASLPQVYGRLVALAPDHTPYRVYQAQSFYKAGELAQASRASAKVPVDGSKDAAIRKAVTQLQALVKYQEEDYRSCRAKLNEMPDDTDTVWNLGAVAFKESKYEEALQLFNEARGALGETPDLMYNIALCHYRLKQHQMAMRMVQEVIEVGARDHPELSVGSAADGVELRSVGNSPTLRDTKLVECFNLKAGIHYLSNQAQEAREALADMPPRTEEELDEVTLHNTALFHMDSDPLGGFNKLSFLVNREAQSPPETFSNLLLLYCKPEFGYYDMAADVLAANPNRMLQRETHEYLTATILVTTSPEEAFRQFDDLSNRHVEALRRHTKHIQDAKGQSPEVVQAALEAYDGALDGYLPCLMAQCRIYWDLENYHQVLKLLRQSEEFCSDRETWQLNMAHTFFMMDNSYGDAIHFYEPFVAKAGDHLTESPACPANVLANLCVAYIMTSKNEAAEELMRRIEREEEAVTYNNPSRQPLHLCIVNLVIGTLYCSKARTRAAAAAGRPAPRLPAELRRPEAGNV